MNRIVQEACDLLNKRQVFVLATIISHSGSTPRTTGSKMIVSADGRGIGTIGGGLLEAGAMARATELIRTGLSAIMPFDLNLDALDRMGMICGGRATVLLARVAPTESNRILFKRWQRVLVERERGCLITLAITTGDAAVQVTHCLANARGEIEGQWPLSDAARKTVAAATDSAEMRLLTIERALVVIEPARPACSAHLFGAGHVSIATAAVAAIAGFRVTVADDREAYANRKRFPDAHAIRVLENFDQAFDGLGVAGNDYIVIVTRGHLHDKTVLAQALRSNAGYIGMIGSRRKRDAIYEILLQEGFSQADIDRVHSPIGLAIGAETPEEIAVSIVAEMIQVRSGH